MSRELTYQAVILKKQPYLEGDEIITFYTREAGKVRALAKSVKFSKSKLQQKLQNLFLVELILAQSRMPKIISVEVKEVYRRLRENLPAVKMAFFAAETVLKFTPDEQKNEQLFDLTAEFFLYLNNNADQELLDLGLLKFKVEALEALGLGVQPPKVRGKQLEVFFNPSTGGFGNRQPGGSARVTAEAYDLFTLVKTTGFGGLEALEGREGQQELGYLLSAFIEYQLERPVKSEQYLRDVV